MKVRELIETLNQVDPELDVTIVDADAWETNVEKVMKYARSPRQEFNYERVILISDMCPASYN